MSAPAGAPGWRVWVAAARPRTLPAAIAPVAVGTAAAADAGGLGALVAWRAGAALVVALALQVAVNFANDAFDADRGVDTAERVGPPRAVAAGWVSAAAMKRATAAALAVAGLAGLALAAATTWWLVAVGLACALAALGYSGGPAPYASVGLGEAFVFVFFGLVATVGSQYVQDGQLGWAAVAAAEPMGFLASAILVANNLRDIPTDAEAGKRTLAVRIGEEATRRLYQVLILASFLTVPLIALAVVDPWPLLALAAAPLAVPPVRSVRTADLGPELITALEGTGRMQLGFGVLLAVGLAVST